MYDLVAILSVEFDLDYLDHFIDHYRDVDKMRFILHSSTDCHPVINHTKQRIRSQVDDAEFTVWIGEFNDGKKCRLQNEIRDQNKWTLYPDIDEFYDFGDHPDNLKNYRSVTHPDKSSELLYGYLQDWMYDRSRAPVPLKPAPDIHSQFRYPCPMLCTSPGIQNKVVAIRGRYKYRNPHHGFMLPDIYRMAGGEFVKIDHYRWTTQRIPKLAHRMTWSRGRLGRETRDELDYYRSKA